MIIFLLLLVGLPHTLATLQASTQNSPIVWLHGSEKQYFNALDSRINFSASPWCWTGAYLPRIAAYTAYDQNPPLTTSLLKDFLQIKLAQKLNTQTILDAPKDMPFSFLLSAYFSSVIRSGFTEDTKKPRQRSLPIQSPKAHQPGRQTEITACNPSNPDIAITQQCKEINDDKEFIKSPSTSEFLTEIVSAKPRENFHSDSDSLKKDPVSRKENIVVPLQETNFEGISELAVALSGQRTSDYANPSLSLLENIPNEIFDRIIAYLTAADRSNLRLVSKSLSKTIAWLRLYSGHDTLCFNESNINDKSFAEFLFSAKFLSFYFAKFRNLTLPNEQYLAKAKIVTITDENMWPQSIEAERIETKIQCILQLPRIKTLKIENFVWGGIQINSERGWRSAEGITALYLSDIIMHPQTLNNFIALFPRLHSLSVCSTKNDTIERILTLVKLTKLQKLNLSSNSILSLAGIENLINLEELNLSHNHFSALPAGIEKLTKLQKLNLSVNFISSLAGIENLINLEELNLSHNNFSALPAGIGKLTKLQKLNLSGNSISSLAGIEKLTKLQELNLSGNSISSLAGIEKLTKLQELNLSGNSISSLAGIEKLTKLQELNLSGNFIASLAGIENLPNLEELNLSGNSISSLAGIEKLRNLFQELFFSPDYSVSLTSVRDLPRLKRLVVSNNPNLHIVDIEQYTPQGLLFLDIRNTQNELDKAEATELKKSKNVQDLQFSLPSDEQLRTQRAAVHATLLACTAAYFHLLQLGLRSYATTSQ